MLIIALVYHYSIISLPFVTYIWRYRYGDDRVQHSHGKVCYIISPVILIILLGVSPPSTNKSKCCGATSYLSSTNMMTGQPIPSPRTYHPPPRNKGLIRSYEGSLEFGFCITAPINVPICNDMWANDQNSAQWLCPRSPSQNVSRKVWEKCESRKSPKILSFETVPLLVPLRGVQPGKLHNNGGYFGFASRWFSFLRDGFFFKYPFYSMGRWL